METVGTPLFWILYVMFVLVAASGLVVTAQVALDRQGLQLAGLPVNFLLHQLHRDRHGRYRRQYPERAGAADVRLDVRPYRAREHDGDRFRRRRRR